MKKIVYPGSFDPITVGHLDVLERSLKIFDEVTVLIMVNPNKNECFSMEERKEFIQKATESMGNIKIEYTTGLLVDWLKENDQKIVLRGLRTVSDYHYEIQLTSNNKMLWDEVEFVFMVTKEEYSYISSSTVKEILAFNGNIEKCVSPKNCDMIKEKFKQKK